jgi:hypothetical protein
MIRKAIVSLCFVCALILVAAALGAQAAATAPAKGAPAKGQTCGGIKPLTCPDGEACRYPANKCSAPEATGVCMKVPATCPPKELPVCGCDGKTYPNLCELLKAGGREMHKGACAPPK